MRRGLLALAGAIAALLAIAPLASATSYQRPFEEVFGPAAQPTFKGTVSIAVDPNGGDVLVGDNDVYAPDSSDLTVYRYNPDGSVAPFAALGSNAIDGKAGPGGKPCAEEPASCDKTPQGGLENGLQAARIAVDATTGDIYVTQYYGNLVDIFSAEGKYLGQLTGAGLKAINHPCGVVVDPSGAVYVAAGVTFGGRSNPSIAKFVPSGNPPVNADSTAVFPFPSGVLGYDTLCNMAVGRGPSAGWIFATAHVSNSGSSSGKHTLKIDDQTGEYHVFAEGFDGGVTVDPTSGNPIVGGVEFDGSLESTSTPLSRTAGIGNSAASAAGDVYAAAGHSVSVYGHPAPVPTLSVNPAANITGSSATLTGTVAPEGLEVSECFFQWWPAGKFVSAETAPCEPEVPTDTGEHTVHATITGLVPNGAKYTFWLVARNENGLERSPEESLTTARTVQTEAASPIGRVSATLNGTLRPEGTEVSQCYFEWGLDTATTLAKAPCSPPAAAIEADFNPHAVSAALGELQEGAGYRFRLVTVDSEGTHKGEQLEFTTLGPPQVSEVRAFGATQTAASIGAVVDPSGFGTSYRLEWGPTSSYGHQVPAEYEPFIGEGTTPVRISAKLSGLSPASTYHYRVIATSSAGITASTDRTLETLSSCGLPEGRCFELVSRREAGPVAIPGETFAAGEMHFQAGAQGSGALAYVVEAGYPEATKGGEVLYRGTRGASGWESTQISPPIVTANQNNGSGSSYGATRWLSDDLSCGFTESWQPLTDDPATRLAIEAGGSDLYRRNPDDTYTAVTALAPENPEAGTPVSNSTVRGASQDCGKVLFSSRYRYPGVPGEGNVRLYEWDEGTLRNAGVIPGPEGEALTAATASGPNLVSEDGSRVFFTAARKTSPIPAERGKTAIFAREDGTVTRDLTLSQTSTPAANATYQWATPDGSRVFFTANAGLTAESSSEGTDLYEYDFARPEGQRLTDLSVDHDAGGAAFNAFLGASEDGSSVYFSARGQLLPGQGRTFADNQSAGTYSVYREHGGEVDFAFTQAKEGLSSGEVSPEGRYLLFESPAPYTGYESGGAEEAYLYDPEAPSEALACLSCRPDGQASVASDAYNVLARNGFANPLRSVRLLTVRDGRAQVFFSSPDALAPGAVQGQNNVYEWSHGQVFRLASESLGQSSSPQSVHFASFAGADSEGSNAYVVTPETLNWEDGDERLSVYDARIGGGFAEPPPPPAPCDATAEGSCGGQGSAGPSVPGAATAAFSGPGNPPAAATKHKKKHKKKAHKKKHKHAKKHKRHPRRSRHANADRRAGK